jgi:hypothetical protein
MRIKLLKWNFRIGLKFVSALVVQLILIVGIHQQATQGTNSVPPTRRVNVPYLQDLPFEPAIFWFGQVDPSHNSIDARLWYYEDTLRIVFHIIDRLHWQDPSGIVANLTNWDSLSLYLDLDGNVGSYPDANAYRLDVQLGGLKATYRGNGTAWISSPLTYSVDTAWRGPQGPNSGVDGKGWQVDFYIPFSSLGLSSQPPVGTVWGLGVVLHDRDDVSGSNIIHTEWPETLDQNIPGSWGQMSFGKATYTPPVNTREGETMIRHRNNDANVVDGAVGGHTICGDNLDHWTEWGDANYAGYTQFNVQNQWDVSDWPCFSKFFVTFPLDSIPSNKVIISATLTMTLFGNAGGGNWGDPPDSYIQVLTVGEDWDEATLSWNNAPLAVENISGTWVYPRDYSVPDQPYHWDISKAVHQAYLAGEPLRLAVYSADGEMHSGKYFWTSDVQDYDAAMRPTLHVVWGNVCSPPDCQFIYLPAILR